MQVSCPPQVPEPKRAAKNVKAAKRGKPELVTKPRVVNSYGTVREELGERLVGLHVGGPSILTDSLFG